MRARRRAWMAGRAVCLRLEAATAAGRSSAGCRGRGAAAVALGFRLVSVVQHGRDGVPPLAAGVVMRQPAAAGRLCGVRFPMGGGRVGRHLPGYLAAALIWRSFAAGCLAAFAGPASTLVRSAPHECAGPAAGCRNCCRFVCAGHCARLVPEHSTARREARRLSRAAMAGQGPRPIGGRQSQTAHRLAGRSGDATR